MWMSDWFLYLINIINLFVLFVIISKDKLEEKDVSIPGDPLVLSCTTDCEPLMRLKWYFKNEAGQVMVNYYRSSKYIQGEDGSLVIMNVTKDDAGEYICVMNNIYFTRYHVTIPGKISSILFKILMHLSV